jgi:4a-hydroxytetrahydrobiopterin dehydratase
MTNLADKRCQPCQGGVPPLSSDDISRLLVDLNDWTTIENHHLTKTYKFPNFALALGFVNRIGELADEQGHHPDLYLAWGKVRVDIWTHKIDGLTESDFVLAAKIDRLPQ